ncbi:hypothetical protein BM477_06960 [Boudabousia marimammalium]|uniref:Gram-positive cocci surface proteins LPxTG domain-containing protein n=1 Tax=Boudabousia marimammalium TaxID=156892 RepID=A0A1Q5PL77_9ACTO|nr:hypothetical protein BM477_06960 [Boudabousia marimammalium]
MEPTVEPTVEPTTEPTVEPTTEPTVEPTVEPTTEVSAVAFANGVPIDLLVQGMATSVEFVFTNAAEGSQWKVALHSDPIQLGVVTVKNGRAKLDISAETTAKFVPGAHVLKLTLVDGVAPKVLEIPVTVKSAGDVTPNDGSTVKPTVEKPVQTTLSKTGVQLGFGLGLAALLAAGGAMALLLRRRNSLQ